jgi:multisubunit Na+/H+ antiporter MnhG subunit
VLGVILEQYEPAEVAVISWAGTEFVLSFALRRFFLFFFVALLTPVAEEGVGERRG